MSVKRIKIKKAKAVLANYRYQGDKAIATYAQDETPILAANQLDRENSLGKFDKYDLDMGFKFASVSRLEWIKIQQLGIQNDPPAIIRYLQHVKNTTGKDFFTTTKRLG